MSVINVDAVVYSGRSGKRALALASIVRQYHGSYKAWLKHSSWQVLLRLGLFSRYRKVNWHNVKRIIFVCEGNVCRSPFAEGVAKDMGLATISVGLVADGMEPADNQAIIIAEEFGISLREHQTMSAESVTYLETDLLVCMTPDQLYRLRQLKATKHCQRTLLGLFHTPQKAVVPDPYGYSKEVYRSSYRQIESSVKSIAGLFSAR